LEKESFLLKNELKREIRTSEGYSAPAESHPIQVAFFAYNQPKHSAIWRIVSVRSISFRA